MYDILAHVKWFTTASPQAEAGFNAAEWLLILGIVCAGLIVLRFVDMWLKNHKITKKLDELTKPLRPAVPLVVRLSTSSLLVINALQNYLLAPNVPNDGSNLASAITILFLGAAVYIALGYQIRIGIVSLVAGYLLVFAYADFFDVIDHIEYLAIAGYLWLRGPGKYSVDKYMHKSKFLNPDGRYHSLDVYRIGVGVALVILSMSEKLLNVTVAQDFLNQHSWNLASFMGVSDHYFILIAGSIELLVGIGLILNYAPRLLITVVLGLMILTAIMLGVEEIYGHLFAAGIVAALWVNDTKPARTE